MHIDLKRFVILTHEKAGETMYGHIPGAFLMGTFDSIEETKLFLSHARKYRKDAYIVETGENIPYST